MARCGQAARMRDGYLRGALSPQPTQRQVDVLAAFVAAGGSVTDAAELVGIRLSTVRRHLADLRARSGLTTRATDLPRTGCWMARCSEPGARLGGIQETADLGIEALRSLDTAHVTDCLHDDESRRRDLGVNVLCDR